MTHDDRVSFDADKYVKYLEVGAASVVVALEVKGVTCNVRIMRTLQCYPLNLQSHCNRRGTNFKVLHVLICMKRDPVIVRHN